MRRRGNDFAQLGFPVARVAVHCTVPGAGQLVAAGVDSVEHG